MRHSDQHIPGGIRKSDHLFVGGGDGTCSRCSRRIDPTERVILLYPEAADFYVFCMRCYRAAALSYVAEKEGEAP
jgi:hypothetical protein